LLNTIQDVARQSKEAGTAIYFDMIPDIISGNFTFRTWKDFVGRDRSSDSDDPLVFSQELENLTDVQLTFDYSEEYNALWILGIGSESGVLGGNVNDDYTNTASLIHDPWSRREFMYSDPELDERSMMDRMYRGLLDGAAAQLALKGSAIDTPLSRYGVDFDLGNLVSAQAGGYEFDCMVEAVAGSYRGGKEKLDIKLSSSVPVLT
jgi:hypothetical protein